MPWALFEKSTQMSKSFPTRAACWAAAKSSGLVTDTVQGDDKTVRPELEDDYEIKEIPEGTAGADELTAAKSPEDDVVIPAARKHATQAR
jgi:hypothetical protein